MEKIELKQVYQLIEPRLELWGSLPKTERVDCRFNGTGLEKIQKQVEIMNIEVSGCISQSGIFINSLINKNKDNTFDIEFDLESAKSYSFELDRQMLVAVGIYASKDRNSTLPFSKNNDAVMFESKDTEIVVKSLQGSEDVRKFALQYWTGKKEDVTGKQYKVTLKIDGKDSRLKYKTVQVPQFKFSLDNNFFPGEFRINNIPIWIFRSIRKTDLPAFFEGKSTRISIMNWAKYLQEGENTLSFTPYSGKDYKPSSKDYLDVSIEPYRFEGTIDYFPPRLLERRVSSSEKHWKMALHVPTFPRRFWQDAEVYDEKKHARLIRKEIENLLRAMKENDKQGFDQILSVYNAERALSLGREEEISSKEILAFYHKKYPGFKPVSPEDEDMEVKVHLDGRLIEINTRKYDSLFYGLVKEKGEEHWFPMNDLPRFLAIKDSRAYFVTD